MSGNNCARWHVVIPSLPEQRTQHALFEIAQIVGTFSQQRAAGVLQDFALHIDRLAPGVSRRTTLFDGLLCRIEQCRVFKQRQMRSEDRFFIGILVASSLGRGCRRFRC
jgi:hypothetical protein